MLIDSPAELPEESKIVEIREPWMNIEVITPTDYYGPIMELVTKRRGEFKGQEYPAPHRVQLNYSIPLSELIVDFFDELKSRTRVMPHWIIILPNIDLINWKNWKSWSMANRLMRWLPSSIRKMPTIKDNASLRN